MLLEATAQRSGHHPRVLEKDFWVCWILECLFTMEGVPNMVFKGGTSLSKVFKAIDRFSEDVDITVDKTGLGFSDDPSVSRTALARAMEAAGKGMLELAGHRLMPQLADLEELEVSLDGDTI